MSPLSLTSAGAHPSLASHARGWRPYDLRTASPSTWSPSAVMHEPRCFEIRSGKKVRPQPFGQLVSALCASPHAISTASASLRPCSAAGGAWCVVRGGGNSSGGGGSG